MKMMFYITSCLVFSASTGWASEIVCHSISECGLFDLDDSTIKNHIFPNLSDKDFFRFCAASSRIRDLLAGECVRRAYEQNYRFQNLVHDGNLNLSENGLRYIYPGAFKGLDIVNNLFLYGNQLRKLDSGVFKELTFLECLDLRNNQLKSLVPGVFEGLNKVKIINLCFNQFRYVNPTAFEGLSKLEHICLIRNSLNFENIEQLRKALPGVRLQFEFK